jgi:hypothetical protein
VSEEETVNALRDRIEAALRASHGENVGVALVSAPDGFHGHDATAFTMGGYAAVRADDEAVALRGLARLTGLDSDGNDRRSAALNAVRSALGHRAEKYGRDADLAVMVAELRHEVERLREQPLRYSGDAAAVVEAHDFAVAELHAEVERITRERDAAIADAASMRDTLYRAAGQACPACGYVAVCP